MQVWDTSKARFTLASSYLHKSCALKDPIIITSHAWIVDVAARRFLGKLPSIVSIHRFAASKTSIAFTTEDRGSMIFIMHLPPNMLAGPDPAA
ncbi:hypothetical protein PILCRDRAFT_130708 [Piloderma croceum F 1598]|uniref:Uncharacterized protein n=1 Tax=Piloderma croceum (strain F 1598) TaxID=765440 RepID=A0A0C3GIM2_PILCF|nr:hypothetical protein PILCRDRAFT_130708 [Piloderma croceum F 1598]